VSLGEESAAVIEAVLLGTGGMMPLPDRWLSSLLVRVNGELTLFDCGEGTQIAWRSTGWSMRRLGAICVSHTHADHVAGLPGLLHAVANVGRREPIEIVGPLGTRDVVQGLRTIAPVLPFDVSVRELGSGCRFALPGGVVGTCREGEHRLPVLAYRLDLARGPAFLPERAAELGVPLHLWRELQLGREARWDGRRARPQDVLGTPRPGLAIAYVTDTRPIPALAEFASHVDLFVCEATYGSDEDQAKAIEHRHMTFREAATLARDAQATRLWLTHFSPAVADPESFLANASDVFPGAVVGHAGQEIALRFHDP
jgi:ribonuclease Z